jgi:hypothetical protein
MQRHTSNANKKIIMWKKKHIFAKICLYDTVGSLPVMPSLLPHDL